MNVNTKIKDDNTYSELAANTIKSEKGQLYEKVVVVKFLFAQV